MELPQRFCSRKNWRNLCLLPVVHCFVNWQRRYWNNCVQDENQRKPINFFIVNMAMSDLLYPIIVIPKGIQRFYIDSWLIGGPLGQVLCKLGVFVSDLSVAVSIQNLVLIAVDRFGAVILPLRSPLISSKLCPFFILALGSSR